MACKVVTEHSHPQMETAPGRGMPAGLHSILPELQAGRRGPALGDFTSSFAAAFLVAGPLGRPVQPRTG